jgi:hypothetical protein
MKVRHCLKDNIQLLGSTEEDRVVLDASAAPSTHPFAQAKPYDVVKPLIFIHVPKCSGTSLIQALVAAGIAPSAFSGFDGTLFGDFAAFESLSRQLRVSIYLNTNDLPKRPTLVRGAHGVLNVVARLPGRTTSDAAARTGVAAAVSLALLALPH